MRYAGNDLSCQNCHLNAGLQPLDPARVDLSGLEFVQVRVDAEDVLLGDVEGREVDEKRSSCPAARI
jgi:hypothetical protein